MALHTPNIDAVASCQLSVARKISPGRLPKRCALGFTLAESLVASVVLAIAVVGVSGAIVASQQQMDAQEEDTTAIALGRQLMEEASALPLSLVDVTAGWPSVTNRSNYDTISDFNGYTDMVTVPLRRSRTLSDAGTFTSASPTVTAITGTVPTLNKQQYRRVVTITYPTSIYGSTVAAGDFAIIKIQVISGGGDSITLNRVLARNTIVR